MPRADLPDSGAPVRLLDGVPYVSLVGLAALLTAAASWGSTAARIAHLEREHAAMASAAATRDDVARLEARLGAIEQLLMQRDRLGGAR